MAGIRPATDRGNRLLVEDRDAGGTEHRHLDRRPLFIDDKTNQHTPAQSCPAGRIGVKLVCLDRGEYLGKDRIGSPEGAGAASLKGAGRPPPSGKGGSFRRGIPTSRRFTFIGSRHAGGCQLNLNLGPSTERGERGKGKKAGQDEEMEPEREC